MALLPEDPKPSRVSLQWLQAAGFYVLATDGARRAIIDSDEAAIATCAAMDPRLRTIPIGNC